MKKVLFVATVTTHINAFHIPFLQLLKKRGYEVHVASYGKEKIEYCDRHYNINFARFPLKFQNFLAYKRLKKIIKKEKYDIVHCHTPVGGVLARLAARKERKKGTRVIYTAHGFHFCKGDSILNWLLFFPIEWFLAKYTDTLITINNEDFQRAKKSFNNRCKDIQFIKGVGISNEKFIFDMSENEKNNLRKSLGIKKEDYILSCIARLNKTKNQIFLIQCMQELIKDYSNIHLLLMGRDENKGYYKKIVKDKGLENNIHFLGDRDDIKQLLKITNIVVSSSKKEGLPINILEAFSSELPVVALKCRGIEELIDNEKNGFIVNNEKEFLDNIKRLYNNKDLAIRIGENALKKSNEFTIEKILEQMKEIYFKKKKVLHILTSNTFSGAENVVCNIINSLKNESDMAYCSPQSRYY